MKPYEIVKAPAEYFKKNTDNPLTIDLGGKILAGYVVLDGTIVVSAGTTSGTAVGEGGPANLIKKIIVRCNASPNSRYQSGDVVSCTPRALLKYAGAQHGKFISDLGGSTLGNGAAGSYNIYCAIPIYFANFNQFRGAALALNADPACYQSIQVIVQTGDLTSCFSGNDRTVDFSGLKLRWVDERHSLAVLPGDSYILQQTDHATLIDAAKTDWYDKAFPKQGALVDALLMTETTVQQTLADTILNKCRFFSDAIEESLTANDIRMRMIRDGFFDASLQSAGSLAGLYYFEFTDGNPERAIPLNDLNQEFDINMVSGSNIDAMRWYTRVIFRPSGFDPNQMSEYGGK